MHSSITPEAFLPRFADRAVKPFRELLVLAGVGVRYPRRGLPGVTAFQSPAARMLAL